MNEGKFLKLYRSRWLSRIINSAWELSELKADSAVFTASKLASGIYSQVFLLPTMKFSAQAKSDLSL
jgi:hypothetical protein